MLPNSCLSAACGPRRYKDSRFSPSQMMNASYKLPSHQCSSEERRLRRESNRLSIRPLTNMVFKNSLSLSSLDTPSLNLSVSHLIDVRPMLDHLFFLHTRKDGIVQEDCLLCCGKHVEVSTTPAPSVFFRKHLHHARKLSPEVCSVCSLLSHKFGEGDGLVKKLV